MKNPPDVIAILELGMLAVISLAAGLFILSGAGSWVKGDDAFRFTIGVFACITFSIVMLCFIFYWQIIRRPKEVTIGDAIILHWRFKNVETIPYESITDLTIDSRAPNSVLTRWTGGAIGFEGKRMRFGFTYDIVMAVRQKYFEKYGRYPPLPPMQKGSG